MAEHPKVHIEPHILDEMREICLELPEAVEAEAFGSPTFQIRSKNFAMTHRDRSDRPSVWVKGAPGRLEAMVGAFPDRYFRPPYWVARVGSAAGWTTPRCRTGTRSRT